MECIYILANHKRVQPTTAFVPLYTHLLLLSSFMCCLSFSSSALSSPVLTPMPCLHESHSRTFSHQHRSNPHRVSSLVNPHILRHRTPANLLPHIDLTGQRVRGWLPRSREIKVVWIIYGATHGTAPLYVRLYLLPGLVR